MSVSWLILSVTVVAFVGATPQWHRAKDGHLYLIEPELKFSWSKASHECRRRGLQLVSIPNAKKNAAFDAMLRTIFTKSHDLWIGATDHETGNGLQRPFYWTTSDKRVTFNNWAKGQPDNYQGVEHCVHIHSQYDFKWNDVNCKSTYGYICEGRFFP